MANFNKLEIKQFPSQENKNSYWSQFKSPLIIKEFSQISSLEFVESDIAIACSTRVQIYSSSGNIKKTISRFKDTVYSTKIRNDQKIMAAGDGSGLVQLFDLSSRAILRSLKGHLGAVYAVNFSPNVQNILTGSDDNSLCLWDITSETAISKFQHSDYVRTCAIGDSPHMLYSGSYDQTIKLWDSRENGKALMELNHGAPIEKIILFPGSNMLFSAGGNTLKAWDILGKGKLVHQLSHHQKTITDIILDYYNSHIITASLDQQVKVVDLVDYKVQHSIKYPAPILSLGISKNNTFLGVGMTSGLLSVRKREFKTEEIIELEEPKAGSYKYFIRGSTATPDADAVEVETKKNRRLQKYDKLLKSFQYANALDATLEPPINPVVVYSMLQELIHREGIKSSLVGRDEKTLIPILKFVLKHISNPRYASLLIELANILLDMYGHVLNSAIETHEIIVKLKQKIHQERLLLQKYNQALGQFELIFTVSATKK